MAPKPTVRRVYTQLEVGQQSPLSEAERDYRQHHYPRFSSSPLVSLVLIVAETTVNQKLHTLLLLVTEIACVRRRACVCYSQLAALQEKKMMCRLHSHLPFLNEILNVFIT